MQTRSSRWSQSMGEQQGLLVMFFELAVLYAERAERAEAHLRRMTVQQVESGMLTGPGALC
jgi:hypothetical protein